MVPCAVQTQMKELRAPKSLRSKARDNKLMQMGVGAQGDSETLHQPVKQ